ncbi:hypothetical protein EJ05DRAFT_499066 [Pseudovirgaria hyperparasitica]|uniref:DAPG hydrolase PhiG domain-containing protein n=1 Tax=Pseudovirgaria hyperparasitica TaxID=470096 RepID=A0A6A6WB25_9PEZI|nr:uncharacterized protein EJ05DRAFT_499066 [Pseudovirgaria hyperparasitica]KAF2759873.1 hypothetical protein EJ05DRAFT_499066 [Pseudovirgaria hyperparasitica]
MHVSYAASITLALALAKTQAFDIRDALTPLTFNDPNVDPDANHYYLGYRGDDFDHPWSKYFNDSEVALNKEFTEGLANSPFPAESGVEFSDAGAALSQPGYLPLENGFTTLKDGSLYMAIRSDVPETFTGEQYDFWFSWHVNDTTKYKLWHPHAHQYAAVNKAELAGNAAKSDYRSRYWNLTSFIDEYIGATAYKISIGFFDPRMQHFELENSATGIETIVTGFVRLFAYNDQDPASEARAGLTPFDIILAHQVRRKPVGGGKEIRSRFWVGPGLKALVNVVMKPEQLARDLSTHCAVEMTHLGTFLPALFAEFKDDLAVVS